jgi:hypothetical protein
MTIPTSFGVLQNRAGGLPTIITTGALELPVTKAGIAAAPPPQRVKWRAGHFTMWWLPLNFPEAA